jgi:hypothetical protein
MLTQGVGSLLACIRYYDDCCVDVTDNKENKYEYGVTSNDKMFISTLAYNQELVQNVMVEGWEATCIFYSFFNDAFFRNSDEIASNVRVKRE